MPTPTLDTRLSTLETSNRRLIAAVLALATILFLLFTLSLAARADADASSCDHATNLQLRSLEIVNDAGVPVIHLGVRDSGAGGLWIADADGHRVLKLNQAADGTGRIAVLDASGAEVGVLAVDGGTVGLAGFPD